MRLFSRKIVQTDPLAPLVELQPLQPPKVEPAAAEAVSTTVLPAVNWSLQEPGVEQLMPPVTVPVPLLKKLTVRIGWGPAGVQPELTGPSTTMWASLLVT